MGTNQFSQPASSQPWERVAALLTEDANTKGASQVLGPEAVRAIAAAALDVAAEGLERAPSEPGLTCIFYLLSQISRSAAKSVAAAELPDRLHRRDQRQPRQVRVALEQAIDLRLAELASRRRLDHPLVRPMLDAFVASVAFVLMPRV